MSRRRFSPVLVIAILATTIGSYSASRAATPISSDFVGATQLIVRLDPAVVTIEAVDTAVGTTTAAASRGIPGSYLLNIPAGADPTAIGTRVGAIPGVTWVDRKSVV